MRADGTRHPNELLLGSRPALPPYAVHFIDHEMLSSQGLVQAALIDMLISTKCVDVKGAMQKMKKEPQICLLWMCCNAMCNKKHFKTFWETGVPHIHLKEGGMPLKCPPMEVARRGRLQRPSSP